MKLSHAVLRMRTAIAELTRAIGVGSGALLGPHGYILAIINLVILAYLNLLGDDALKIRSIHWLTSVNGYALGVILGDVLINKSRNKSRRDGLGDVNKHKK